MKRMMLVAALLAVAAPVMAPGTATAHGPDFIMVGFQYTYLTLVENGGIAGYVSTPAGPQRVSDGPTTSTDDGIGLIVNRDAVPHTFTECTAGCDGPSPSKEGSRFHVPVAAGASVAFRTVSGLPLGPGRYMLYCAVPGHAFMRGTFLVD